MYYKLYAISVLIESSSHPTAQSQDCDSPHKTHTSHTG